MEPPRAAATAPNSITPNTAKEVSEGITLQADMPGVSKEQLNLRVEGNSLLVEGTIGIARPKSR